MSNHFFQGLGNETQKVQLQKSLSFDGLHLDTSVSNQVLQIIRQPADAIDLVGIVCGERF